MSCSWRSELRSGPSSNSMRRATRRRQGAAHRCTLGATTPQRDQPSSGSVWDTIVNRLLTGGFVLVPVQAEEPRLSLRSIAVSQGCSGVTPPIAYARRDRGRAQPEERLSRLSPIRKHTERFNVARRKTSATRHSGSPSEW
jgi:hypothetical protein